MTFHLAKLSTGSPNWTLYQMTAELSTGYGGKISLGKLLETVFQVVRYNHLDPY